MQLTSDAIVALSIFLATQTGALIFFAGVVAFTLKNHDSRLTTVERDNKKSLVVVAQLAQKEGIQL